MYNKQTLIKLNILIYVGYDGRRFINTFSFVKDERITKIL